MSINKAFTSAPSPDEFNQLIGLYSARRYAELETRANALIGRYPDSGFAWKLLGAALQMQGKPALPAFQKTAQLMPADAEAHFNLGVVLKSTGQAEQAAASYRNAIRINPAYAEAHGNLGNVLKDLGKLDEAVASYRNALKIKPGDADAHNNLGTALKDLGKLDEATESYRRAITLRPAYADAHYNLGNALKDLGRYEEATESYRRAIEIKPDFVDAHMNLAVSLRELNQFDNAMASYRHVLDMNPKNDEALLGLSHLSVVNGEISIAEELVNKALEINPHNLNARFLLANIRKAEAGDENLSVLLDVAEASRSGISPLSDKALISLHFALGKCFDELGEHDRAFPHFIEGCKLKRATLKYDAELVEHNYNEVMRIINRETIERLKDGGSNSHEPIFVVGMPRSGTTLTEQIISSHPDVHGAGELPDLPKIIQRNVPGTTSFPASILALDRTTLSQWGEDYVTGLRQYAPDALHITDKLPINFWFLGLIHVMLPNAKIIHVNRNPVDTCLSCFTRLSSRGLEQSYDLTELGRYYAGYARLMDHWRDILPAGAFLEVQYEDIVSDQETQARRIIAFCGLDWNDACINFHKHKRSVNTASMTQVRRPIYKSSVERWRPYENYLGPLLDALGDLAPQRTIRER